MRAGGGVVVRAGSLFATWGAAGRAVLLAGLPLPAVLPTLAGLPLFVPCYFRLLTGVPCPGCGLTRGTLALFRGDLAAAVAFHPLVPLFAIQAVGLVLVVGWRRRPPQRVIDLLVGANLLLLIGVWVGRLASGTAPP